MGWPYGYGRARFRAVQPNCKFEFESDAQFSAQAAPGIHTGLHGRSTALAGEFQIEVFRQIVSSSLPLNLDPS